MTLRSTKKNAMKMQSRPERRNDRTTSATVLSQCNSLPSGPPRTISTGFTPTNLGYKSATLRFTTTFGDIFPTVVGTGTSPALRVGDIVINDGRVDDDHDVVPSRIGHQHRRGWQGQITSRRDGVQGIDWLHCGCSTAAGPSLAPGSCTIAATAAATVDCYRQQPSVTFVVALASQTITVVPGNHHPCAL